MGTSCLDPGSTLDLHSVTFNSDVSLMTLGCVVPEFLIHYTQSLRVRMLKNNAVATKITYFLPKIKNKQIQVWYLYQNKSIKLSANCSSIKTKINLKVSVVKDIGIFWTYLLRETRAKPKSSISNHNFRRYISANSNDS